MPFKIVRNDITKMHVDAIVNTANSEPVYSSGTDTAVYKAAGEEELLAERRKIGSMKEGEVAITSGFNLPAKYIIHAVSPRFIDGSHGEERKLRSCYRKSLQLAHKNGCETIAFPLISTGSFGYPKEEAMRIAVDEINAFLLKNEMLIYLVVFDSQSTQLGKNLYSALESYIDNNYVAVKRKEEYGGRPYGTFGRAESCQSVSMSLCEHSERMAPGRSMSAPLPDEYEEFAEKNQLALQNRMKHMSDTFQEYLLYLIQEKGMTNAEVYNRAFVTKQVFSKIKVNPNYHPDKTTAMRLCVGAMLSLDETKDLLARAGYALSPCDKRDIIFSFFIENKIYDMIEIDIALEEYDLKCFIE